MAHILYGYAFHALEGALERVPTKEEYHRAIDAIEKYDPSAFEVIRPKINKNPKEEKPLSLWGRIRHGHENRVV